MPIHAEVAEIALERVTGAAFEQFCNEFFPSLLGVAFQPLGGLRDGGADGFADDPVYERSGRAGHFYQASVEVDPRAKIKKTVKRLREFGREPKVLTYFTSRRVLHLDVVEDELSEELDATIRIRDGLWITAHVNDTPATELAFKRHLEPLTDYLNKIGSSTIVAPSRHVTSPAAFVFLRQEVDKLDGDLSLVNSVTDSLALWALEGTDPDLGKFMTRDEVVVKIEDQIPATRNVLGARVPGRLEALSKKDYPAGGRQIKWHRKDDQFCLPFDTRARLAAENASDEALMLRVQEGLRERARGLADLVTGEAEAQAVAASSIRAIQLAFEHEGLEFAHFLQNSGELSYPPIGDLVREGLEFAGISGEGAQRIAEACLTVTRAMMYHGSVDERDYMGRLARTYALLFTLSSEPRLVDYFQRMASDFYLYVGSDMLVRALSERYLEPPNQLCRNTLLIAARAGAELILTQPVLDEVLGNLRASDFEFLNQIQPIEQRVTVDMAREVPKILVRAYLYNRSEPQGPTNWPAFVSQFVTYTSLHKVEAEQQLRNYLTSTFSMKYRSNDDLAALTKPAEVEALTTRLLPVKRTEQLARNDALMCCAVYGHRRRKSESSAGNEFGFKTWWLTNETAILRHTRELQADNLNARYMMRPDFLLNFLAFAPQAAEVRKLFATVFPSSLGVQLSKRMDEEAFHKIMADVREAEGYEDGRRIAIMAECADKLKADFTRRYRIELSQDSVL